MPISSSKGEVAARYFQHGMRMDGSGGSEGLAKLLSSELWIEMFLLVRN